MATSSVRAIVHKIVAVLLTFHAFLLCSAGVIRKEDFSSCSTSESSYDFIVIGGGTGGLAVASRLSQKVPSSTILVLEAGPDARSFPGIYIPGFRGSTLGGTYDWNYTTVPQQHANNRRWAANRGKVLGGSSALNLMCWDRGVEAEYDSWESLGSPGWDWGTMIDAMLQAENYTQELAADGTLYNAGLDSGVGSGGPMQSTVNEYVPEHQLAWVPTLKDMGFDQNLDPLNGDNLGVSWQPSAIWKTTHKRSYSPDYLRIAGQNLCIHTNSTGHRILFGDSKDDHGSYTASGIELSDGTVLYARKEVILSAGTFESPALLERSGIGQPSVISTAGMTTLVDLPGVGENLQDHFRVTLALQLKPGLISFDQTRVNKTYAAEQRALYDAGKRSAYWYTASAYFFGTWGQVASADEDTLVSLAAGAAEADTSVVSEQKFQLLHDISVPQIEVIFSDGYTGLKGYPSNTSSLYGSSYTTIIAGIQHAMSRGTVHINASDPQGKPVIDPRYLSTEYDIQAAIAAAKFNRKIAMSEPLRDYWVAEYEPGPEVVSDQQLREYVLNSTATFSHPVGSCSMMPRDQGGVVDPSLKVYGTSNVRVVDASVMPLLISGHIQTAVYGIAERAAEIIATECKV